MSNRDRVIVTTQFTQDAKKIGGNNYGCEESFFYLLCSFIFAFCDVNMFSLHVLYVNIHLFSCAYPLPGIKLQLQWKPFLLLIELRR